MRISTTPLLIICTVIFFSSTLVAWAQTGPEFTVTNRHHTCGPTPGSTGSFDIVVTAASGSATLNISVVGPGAPAPVSVPMPSSFPYVHTISGLTGTTAGRTYFVVLTDSESASPADGINPVIFNFNATQGTVVDNTDATCNAPNGSISVNMTGSSSALPFVFSWTGPDGFTASTKDISGLRGGDYTLTYSDSNTPPTTCVLGPIHIDEPAPPSFAINSPDPTICEGDVLQVNVTATSTSYTYEVLEGASVLQTQAGTGAAMLIPVAGLAVGSHTLRVRAVAGTCPPVFNDAPDLVANVNPIPTYNGATLTSICGGTSLGAAANLDLFKVGTVTADEFTIQNVSFGALQPVAGSPTTTGDHFAANVLTDDVWKNATAAEITVTYDIVPVANGCPGPMFQISIGIGPQPDYNDHDGTAPGICSRDAIGVTLDPLAKGTSFVASEYNIVDVQHGALTIAGGAPVWPVSGVTSNEIADDRWQNVTDNFIDVEYTIEPVSALGCVGDPFHVIVRVNPQPDYVDPSVLAAVCSGVQLGVNLNDLQKPNTLAATLFDITVNSNGLILVGGGPADGTDLLQDALFDDQWKNTSTLDVDVEYTITPKIGATCVGNTFHVTIPIRPEPVYDDATPTICSDEPVNYDLATSYNSGATATTFNITINSNGLTAKAGSPADGNGLPSTVIMDDVWENLTNNSIDVVYTVTPVSAVNCVGTPFIVTVHVTPEPDFKNYSNDNAPGGICSGDMIALNLSTLAEATSVAADTYEITSVFTTDPSLTRVGGPAPVGAGHPETILMTEAWINSSAVNQSVTYHIVPYNGTCKGDEFTVTVTYVPRPAYSDNPDLIPGGICAVPIGVDLHTMQNPGSVQATTFDVSVAPNTLVLVAGGPVAGVGLPSSAIADDVWSNTTAAVVPVEYTITPYNGTCAGPTFTVVVNIKPQPDYDDSATTVCSDVPFAMTLHTLRVGASAMATSFDIDIDADPLLVNTATTPMAEGVTTNPILGDKWRNRETTPLDVRYIITPIVNGCAGADFTVTVTINPEPVYQTPAGAAPVICSEDNVNIDLASFYSAGATATVFDISAASVPAGLTPVGATTLTATGDNTVIADDKWRNVTNAPKDIVYTVTPTSADGCEGAPFTVTVTVSPQPDYADFPINGICSGAGIGLNLNDGQGGASALATSFTVTDIIAPSLTAVVPAAPRAFPFDVAAGDLATDVWKNVTTLPQTAVYKVIPKAGTCAGEEFEVTVTVTPEPVYTDFTNTVVGVCSDLPIGVDLSGQQDLTAVAATGFNLVSVDFTGLTASTNANTTAGPITATSLADDQWVNTSGGVHNVIYTIAPLNGTCVGAEFTVTVAINPEPVGVPLTKDICSDAAVNVDLQADAISQGNNLPATTFEWIATDNPDVSNESVTTQTSTVIGDILTNNTSVVQQVVYIVTPTSSGGCVGEIFTVMINVNPKPVIEPGQTVDICEGSPVNYSIRMLPPDLPAGTTLEWPDPDGAGPATASPGPVALGPSGTIHINDVLTVVGTVTYMVTPKVAGGTCAGDPVAITVNVQLAATAEAGPDQAICTDNGPYSLIGSSVGGSASTGAWFIQSQPAGGDGAFSVPEGTHVADPTTISFSATEPGDYVLRLETDDPASVCGPVSDVVTITVTPKPVLDTNPPKLICGNEPVNYEIQLTPAGLPLNTVFEWADPDGPSGPRNATASPVGGVPMGAPGTLHITDILKNDGTSNVDVIYEVTPRVGLCVGAMQQIVITVKPSPVVVFGQAKTICSGDQVDHEILLSPLNTPAGTTFSWPDPDGAGPATSKQDLPAGPAGTLHIQDVLYNATGAPTQVLYDVISQGSNGCFGDTRRVTITVNPGAVAEAGNAQTVCSGATVILAGASVGGAADGTWDVFTNPGDGALSDTNATTTPDQVTFTATVGGTYVLRLTSGTPTLGSCSPVSDFVTITVKAPGDPTCTGSGGPASPCDQISVAPQWTAATCNNSDGSVHFEILNINTGLPAVPASGSIRITIDGETPGVNFNDPDFSGLAVDIYTYEVQFGDATCVKTGTFTIDRSGTVGLPVATIVEEPSCFGGTGTATINALNTSGTPIATGVSLEWSEDGITWNAFIGGSDVTGLPAGTNSIFVRRPGDPCAGEVNIAFSDPADITATFAPNDATCNNNDGAIVVNNLAGGTGPYTFTLNGTALNPPANNTFAGLTANSYTIEITDSKSCVKTFGPVLISFPGFVNTTAPVTTAPDCTSGGTNGKVEFSITDPGSFEFAITTDPVVAPTVYNPLGGNLVSVGNLAHGDYSIWLRPVGAGLKCATKIAFSISGIYSVSYNASTSDVTCFAQPTSIVLNDIKGAPALPFTYTLTNTANNSVTTGTISAAQAMSAFSLTNINPGNYSVLLTQDQSSIVSSCTDPVSGGAKALVINGPSAPLDSLYVNRSISFPDLPSGSAVVGVSPSGLQPYETKLELTNPMFGGQEFVSDWSEVTVNPLNLKYEKQYSNLFAGQYTLGIRDAGGCERTYVFTLNVDANLFIPNIFTPNGDGHNEVFYIRNLPNDSKLLITNRWGKEVYKSSSYQNDWNGGDAVDGMYYYTLTLGSQSYTGWVEILRGQ